MMRGEIRNQKSEIRKKIEIRSPKLEIRKNSELRIAKERRKTNRFGIPVSEFFRVSVLRILSCTRPRRFARDSKFTEHCLLGSVYRSAWPLHPPYRTCTSTDWSTATSNPRT